LNPSPLHIVPGDAELLRFARAGDVHSMGLLLERHRAGLHAHALKILGYTAHDGIEDLVQETFLLALNRISQLQNPDAFRWWLHAILRNVCYGQLRRNRLLVQPLTDHLADVTEDSSVDPSRSVSEPEDQVWAALELLPENLRATVLLRYFGRMNSYEEIAKVLAIPVGTVRSRLHEARTQLAAAFHATAGRDGGAMLERGEQQARNFLDRWSMLYEGKMKPVLELYSEHVTLVFSAKVRKSGRSHLEQMLLADHVDGIRYQFDQLLFSGKVSVVEFDNINPPHAPFHCPPKTVLVSFHDERVVRRVHVYESPRIPVAA
jgi:RNA polymerase sigma factor (sigma-70 family)